MSENKAKCITILIQSPRKGYSEQQTKAKFAGRHQR